MHLVNLIANIVTPSKGAVEMVSLLVENESARVTVHKLFWKVSVVLHLVLVRPQLVEALLGQ